MTLPVSVGELLYLKEADYAYGTGDLALRVTQILSADRRWVQLRGIEIRWDGSRDNERPVAVLLSALRESRTHETP